MSKTGLHCTNCKAEFELDDTVILKDTGFVSLTGLGGAIVIASDSPFLQQLCENCGGLLQVKEKPNRVVIEVMAGVVVAVRAERPADLHVTVLNQYTGVDLARKQSVTQLVTVKEPTALCPSCNQPVQHGDGVDTPPIYCNSCGRGWDGSPKEEA